jgi:hypothetical protein
MAAYLAAVTLALPRPGFGDVTGVLFLPSGHHRAGPYRVLWGERQTIYRRDDGPGRRQPPAEADLYAEARSHAACARHSDLPCMPYAFGPWCRTDDADGIRLSPITSGLPHRGNERTRILLKFRLEKTLRAAACARSNKT